MNKVPAGVAGVVTAMVLEYFTFSTLLSNDTLSCVLRVLFYGPFVGAETLLRFSRDSLGVPIPTTMFGGLPGWLGTSLLILNWGIYAVVGFFIGQGFVTGKHSANRLNL